MLIQNIIRPLQEVVVKKEIQLKRKENTTPANSSIRSQPQDRVDLSHEVKSLSIERAQHEQVRVQANSTAEIRIDKVEEVKKKIESGYYNLPEFNDVLAEKLMKII